MQSRDQLVALRRSFHEYPEPAWCEFVTTARLVSELRAIGVDELAIGPEAYNPADQMAVPDDTDLARWRNQATDHEAVDASILERMSGGNTGVVAVLEQGDGPTVGLRVDIDGLYIEESTNETHRPASKGFQSQTGDTMHACGHDVHMTWGLATLAALKERDFAGRFVVFFQPAEEVSGGGFPMSRSPYIEDIDYLFAAHVGLGHSTGTVVAGIERPLAEARLDATFTGTAAHAGKHPEAGDNAIQAMATATQNAYAIPRHSEGDTRINIGTAQAGSASNVIADHAHIEGEVRGETTALREYMQAHFHRIMEASAAMHDCTVDTDLVSETPRADSSPSLRDLVTTTAGELDCVSTVVPTADFGASEDATCLMERVQTAGGLATYLIIGADHPTGHHTPTFDVDETCLETGRTVLTESILAVSE